MWMFTRHGIYSVVCIEEDCYHVRARQRTDLERLLKVAKKVGTTKRLLGRRPRIVATPVADYPFRLVVSGAAFYALAEALARDVDYPNFKSAATAVMPDRSGLLHRVWATVAELGCGLFRGGDAYLRDDKVTTRPLWPRDAPPPREPDYGGFDY